MSLTDTHAHIYLDQFGHDLDEVMQRCRKDGIDRVYMPNIDSTTTGPMLEVEEQYPGYCVPMMGLHPCSVDDQYEAALSHVREMLGKRPFAAVGEIGIDLHWDKTYYRQQVEVFLAQVELALDHRLPVVIHCRESLDIVMELVQKGSSRGLKGIFHCFTGTPEQAKKIVDMGFFLGIGGVATFKKGGLEPVLHSVDLDYLVLETDSPYLAPAPYRGKRNEPSYLTHIAAKVAEEKGCDTAAVAEATSRNAAAIFNSI